MLFEQGLFEKACRIKLLDKKTAENLITGKRSMIYLCGFLCKGGNTLFGFVLSTEYRCRSLHNIRTGLTGRLVQNVESRGRQFVVRVGKGKVFPRCRSNRCTARFERTEIFSVFQKHERQPAFLKPLCIYFNNTPQFFCAGAAVVYHDGFKKRCIFLRQNTV